MYDHADRFHEGERRAQSLAGFNAVTGAFHDSMPDQHRSFFAALPYIFASSIDDNGWPVATLFSGPPGFISSPDERHLRIHALRREDDPGQAAMRPGQHIGLLGLDFSNRRRNRANGHISRMDKNRLEIAVVQSFGNCPKYIQSRRLEALTRSSPLPAIEYLTVLDTSAKTLITQADTFFIASYAQGDNVNGGADISHRGGQPGFVRLVRDTLWIPDFSGNRYMNTLGNLLAQPRAALLFMDFERGDILHLQGTTDIVWQPDANCPAGTERYWRLRIRNAWRFRSALPWRGWLQEYSPATLQTGVW
jgi:hypothetical protein